LGRQNEKWGTGGMYRKRTSNFGGEGGLDMKKLAKSVLREMKKSKFQYSGAIVLLSLAVLLYVMLYTAIHTLEQSNEQFMNDYVQEDFHVITGIPLSDEQMDQLEQQYDVVLEERKQKDLSIDKGKSLRIFTISENVNVPYVEEGELPTEENEIALAQSYATMNELNVGDTLTLGNQEWTISGTIYLPDYVYMLKNLNDLFQDPASFGIALVNDQGFERLPGEEVTFYSGYWSQNEPLDEFKDTLSSYTPIILWVNSDENPRISYIETEIEGVKTTTTVFPLFIGTIVVFMVMILLKRRLELQRSQLGTLLSIGYRKGELIRSFLLYPLIVSLIGSILGIVSGWLLSVPITEVYRQFFNIPLLGNFYVYGEALGIAFLLPVAFLCLTSAGIVAKQLQKSPIDLLRPPMFHVKGYRRFTFPFRLKKFSTRFRLRMLTRNIGRALLLSFGIIFSTMLLMFGIISMNSMDTLLNKTYKESLTYDYAYYFQKLQQAEEPQGDEFSFGEGKLRAINGNNLNDERTVQVYGIDSSTELLRLKNKEGEDLLPDLKEGAIITKTLAYALNLREGDELNVWSESSQQSLTITIQGIAEIYAGTFIYYDRQMVNEWLQYPEGSYVGLWTKQPLPDSKGVYMIESKEDIIQSFTSLMEPMRYLLLIMSLLAFIIGGIIVSLITNLIIEENTTTISLMKIIGYRHQSIASLILNIYTPVVVISYFIGVPISLYSVDTLIRSIADETNYALPVGVDYFFVLVGLLVIFASYYASLTLSRRKLKKVSLQEVLKGQER
jgi:putative ABC transport system permease protein